MRNQGVVLTEDEKSFLQEGSSKYAAALLALSEFRRRVAARRQNVLDEFSLQLDQLGLPTAGFKIVGSKLEDQDLGEQSASIGLRKNCGGELYSGCFVGWDFSEAKGRQPVGKCVALPWEESSGPKSSVQRFANSGRTRQRERARTGFGWNHIFDSILRSTVFLRLRHDFSDAPRGVDCTSNQGRRWTARISADYAQRSSRCRVIALATSDIVDLP